MDNSFSSSYKDAGVDITKGYEAVELMKKHVKKTRERDRRRRDQAEDRVSHEQA